MAAEMLISGAPAPPPPRLIAPLQMGRECALHADERGLAAFGPAVPAASDLREPRPGALGPGAGDREGAAVPPLDAPPGTGGHPAGRAREARFSLFISPKWDLK